jgi:hypothetical protein
VVVDVEDQMHLLISSVGPSMDSLVVLLEDIDDGAVDVVLTLPSLCSKKTGDPYRGRSSSYLTLGSLAESSAFNGASSALTSASV